jgi:hypothetical protein
MPVMLGVLIVNPASEHDLGVINLWIFQLDLLVLAFVCR